MTCNAYLGSGTTTDDHGIRDKWGLGLLGPSDASFTIIDNNNHPYQVHYPHWYCKVCAYPVLKLDSSSTLGNQLYREPN
jgi:hypothetical protein